MKQVSKLAAAAVVALGLGAAAQAQQLLSEGFENIGTLSASGWKLTNNSTAGGLYSWFQGNTVAFDAAAGPANSYIGANFNSAPMGGSISNWLITPELALDQNVRFDFALRLLGEGVLDTVEVYLSSQGASSNVGATTQSTGDFQLLRSYSSDSDTGWMSESLLVGAVGAMASGRFAFRYVVGDTSLNGDYIGIDSVSANAVPEPGSLALVGLALAGASFARRRKPAA